MQNYSLRVINATALLSTRAERCYPSHQAEKESDRVSEVYMNSSDSGSNHPGALWLVCACSVTGIVWPAAGSAGWAATAECRRSHPRLVCGLEPRDPPRVVRCNCKGQCQVEKLFMLLANLSIHYLRKITIKPSRFQRMPVSTWAPG